jgi:hypothetical protein
VKERNEETGELEVTGHLNRMEVSFLLQFAINTLMMQGVIFDLSKEVPETEMRITMPEGSTLQ